MRVPAAEGDFRAIASFLAHMTSARGLLFGFRSKSQREAFCLHSIDDLSERPAVWTPFTTSARGLLFGFHSRPQREAFVWIPFSTSRGTGHIWHGSGVGCACVRRQYTSFILTECREPQDTKRYTAVDTTLLFCSANPSNVVCLFPLLIVLSCRVVGRATYRGTPQADFQSLLLWIQRFSLGESQQRIRSFLSLVCFALVM